MAPSTCSRTPNIVFFWNTDIWFLNLLALKILGGWFLSHSFQNSQVPDTTCVHKLIPWNLYTYTNVLKTNFLKGLLTDCKIFSKLSTEHMHTRVQPQGLLDHLLKILHVLKVTKRRIACRISKYLFQFSNSFLLYTQSRTSTVPVVDL